MATVKFLKNAYGVRKNTIRRVRDKDYIMLMEKGLAEHVDDGEEPPKFKAPEKAKAAPAAKAPVK